MTILRGTASALALAIAGAAQAQVAPAPDTAIGAPTAPNAQTAPPAADAQDDGGLFGDVVVTARRRSETLQEAPVAVTAFGEAFIERFKVQDVQSIATFTPGLITGPANTGAGGNLYLRGVGSPTYSGLVDPAITINIDGVQVGSQVMRAGMFDLGQIEVLRGPQALFFGKNSPGGVISIQSAKPTRTPYYSVTGGYEFSAHEKYVEVVGSMPITDTLRARVAGRYSFQDGYWKLRSYELPGVVFGTGGQDRAGPGRDSVVKANLIWEPSDRFDMSGTVIYTSLHSDYGVPLQRVSCPAGAAQTILPQSAAVEDCEVNQYITAGIAPAAALAINPLARGAELGYLENEQVLGAVTANLALSDQLKLTSVSGYYRAKDNSANNFSIEPLSFVYALSLLNARQFSEELRLASSFGGAFNFTLGGYYEDSRIRNSVQIIIPPDTREIVTQDRTVWSTFGQLSVKPVDRVEITAGGRYSDEKKSGLYVSNLVPGSAVAEDRWKNFSPEATVQFKPTPGINLYGSYKEGFKSGGLDAGSGRVTAFVASGGTINVTYDQERVRGFEAGAKFSFMNSRANLNLAAFTYKYRGLQLTNFDPTSFAITVSNVAGARVRGLEGDFNVRPAALDGLTLYGNLAYLDAKYTDFLSDCYTGQSIAQGCNLTPNAGTGLFQQQDLSVARLRNAPEWTAALGANVDVALGRRKLGLSVDGSYSSGYSASITQDPGGHQSEYVLLNASARLPLAEGFELAVIGRNLTDEFVFIETATTFANGANVTGGPTSHPADLFGNVNPGRQVRLQLTYRFP